MDFLTALRLTRPPRIQTAAAAAAVQVQKVWKVTRSKRTWTKMAQMTTECRTVLAALAVVPVTVLAALAVAAVAAAALRKVKTKLLKKKKPSMHWRRTVHVDHWRLMLLKTKSRNKRNVKSKLAARVLVSEQTHTLRQTCNRWTA